MVTMRMKALFFDRQKVKNAADRANQRNLSRGAAFVRQRAKSSIRKRVDPAPPGQPPHSHVGLLKRLIFFGYERRTESAVVGPEKLAKAGDIPHTLEFGGRGRAKRDLTIRVGKVGREKGTGRFTKARRKRIEKGTKLVYKPRPFMAPALEKERGNLPPLWRNSVRGS